MRPRKRASNSLWIPPVFAVSAVLAGGILAAHLVRASSTETWDALVKEAGAACQIASELGNPRVLWSNPAYERQAALLITGKWPQTHMKGEQGYMLCLFDKQSAKLEIQEVDPALFK